MRVAQELHLQVARRGGQLHGEDGGAGDLALDGAEDGPHFVVGGDLVERERGGVGEVLVFGFGGCSLSSTLSHSPHPLTLRMPLPPPPHDAFSMMG